MVERSGFLEAYQAARAEAGAKAEALAPVPAAIAHVLLDALFEQHGDDIFVSNLAPMDFQHGSITMTVDGEVLPPFAKTVLKPGSRVQIGDELYEVNRNVHAHA